MDHPTPGSAAAVAADCTCDPDENANGTGTPEPTGAVFIVDLECPLHGVRVILAELTEARL
jgi:hypothetical protein